MSEAVQTSSRRRSRGNRQARDARAAAARSKAPNPAFINLRNPYPPIEQFTAEQIETIHDRSMTILSEFGLRVLSRDAREIFRKAGALVDEADQRVRFDADLIMAAIGTAPKEVTLVSRDPARNVTVGSNKIAFAAVGGPPNFSDLDQGRRPGTLQAYDDFVRLTETYDVVHIIGNMVEPVDHEPRFRHLETTRSNVVLSNKVPFVFCRGTQAVRDAFEIMRLSHGIEESQMTDASICYTVVNANSPLQLDDMMSKGIMDFARAGQLMILTPFTLAGAMAPVTIPGALAQQNAEALAGIALAQLTVPGAPVAYGGFTSNVDMKSGAPAFGTPEYVKAAFASGQLARRYGLPFRSSNVNASNAPDAQSAYESQMSLWGAMMGGCNLLMHGAGWLEGGLTASFEKFIIDVEMLQMFASLMQPVTFDEDALALSAIREIEPGGHYFGTQHTLSHYETAFYSPMLSDWRNFENWTDAGSVDTAHRANAIFKQTLKDFEAPPIDTGAKEAIDEFVARRRAEGGANLEA